MLDNPHIKSLAAHLAASLDHLKTELNAIRSNRPSLESVEHLKVIYFDQPMAVNQLGSLSISPPRDIIINVWDKNAVGPIMNAIQGAQVGLSVSNDGTLIRASLSAMSNERREELTKLVRKQAEAARIGIRANRDDVMKALKQSKDKKELTEDEEFRAREEVQKQVDKTNEEIEKLVAAKLQTINE